MQVKTEKFTDRLFKNAQPIWEANHNHPFVQELGKGTLEKEKFIYYMKQDYVYLIEYAKLFAIASVKSPELDTMAKFASILDDTLHFEMDLHRQFAAEFGITAQELEATKATPVNLAYTNYMLNAAQSLSVTLCVGLLGNWQAIKRTVWS